MVEKFAVVGSNVWELSAAFMQMKESKRPIKILTVPLERVRQAAIIFESLSVEGVVPDSMGPAVIPVAATG